MKKFYLFLCLVLLINSVRATTYTVNVSDNIFSPDNFTTIVGDTIMWMWINGNHTTTSTSVPLGAVPWNGSLNQNNQMFSYIITMAGNYDYQCNFHYTMGMVGHFTANEASGIKENQAGVFLNIRGNPTNAHQIHIDFNTVKSDMYDMSLNDITGHQVMMLMSGQQSAGEHHYDYNVADLAKGIYLLKLSSSETDIVRKVIVD